MPLETAVPEDDCISVFGSWVDRVKHFVPPERVHTVPSSTVLKPKRTQMLKQACVQPLAVLYLTFLD